MKIAPNTNFDIFPQKQHMKAHFPKFSRVWWVSHGGLESLRRFFGTHIVIIEVKIEFITQFAVNHYLAVSMPTTKSGAHADLFDRVGQKYVFSTFRKVKHKMPQGWNLGGEAIFRLSSTHASFPKNPSEIKAWATNTFRKRIAWHFLWYVINCQIFISIITARINNLSNSKHPQ